MTRSPVARFVGVVAAVAAVLVLVAWSGAGAPAVHAQSVGEGTQDDGRVGYLVAQIHNTGSLPVDIREITWHSDGLTGSEVLVGPIDEAPTGARPFAPFTLDGDEQVAVVLQGTVTCPLPGDVVTVGTDPLEVEAKPAAGPARTLRFDLDGNGQGMVRTLPCPPR